MIKPGPDDGGASHEHQIPPGSQRFTPGSFTQQTLGPVADDGASDAPTRHDGNPTRGAVRLGGRDNQNNERVGVRSSFTPHPLDFGCAS
ncbi:MAG TPA: hypothetical protein PLC98_03260 [Anaerolineales bacterium]|nr:hypothetical protein [Anaerolineales bacterium]